MIGWGSQAPRIGRAVGFAPLLILAVVVGALLPARVGAEHWAPPRTVYVPSTGHTTDGLFLQAWRDHRALLGDPITEELAAKTGYANAPKAAQIVQYYENGALVYLPDEEPDAQVQTLDLGRQALDLALAARPPLALQRAARRTACSPSSTDCLGFAETGHTLRGFFRDSWEAGDGVRWLGQPLTEAYRAADGSWLQYFEGGALRARAGGEPEPLPLGTAAAKRLRLATGKIERPNGIPVYDETLFVAPPEPEPVLEPSLGPAPGAVPDLAAQPVVTPWTIGSFGPGPQRGDYQEIVVSISQQALWAYEGGELVIGTSVSTGTAEVLETTTPVGQWSILTKVDVQDMEGTISDEYYFVEDVPDVMYFDNLGNALHGTYWHTNFGAPMSHGCVNLPLETAAWLYDWAAVGTAVTVVP